MGDDTNLASFVELIRRGSIPQVEAAEDRPLTEEDFGPDVKGRCLAVLKDCAAFLDAVDAATATDKAFLRSVVVPTLLLAAEFAQPSAPYSTPEHISQAYRILSSLKRLFGAESAQQLLHTTAGGRISEGQLVRWCVRDLSSKLEVACFKKYPGAQASLVWLVHSITFPRLSAFLADFLPFALRFLDDWQPNQKLTGLLCLRHVIANVSPSELALHGRLELIESALSGVLHVREQRVVDVLLPTFIEFLALKQKSSPAPAKASFPFDASDQLMKRLLYSAELESGLDLRRSYLTHLSSLLEFVGVRVARWLSRLVRIWSAVLAVEDPLGEATRRECLRQVQTAVRTAAEAFKPHVRDVLEGLLRLLYDASKASEAKPDKERLLDLCVNCIKMVRRAAPEEFAVLCQGMEKCHVNRTFDSAWSQATSDMEE